MRFLDQPTRFLFFTGKGGVGKTSLACASAVSLANSGHQVLLVSTDPASNIGQVFSTTIGSRITPIVNVPGLAALEINPDEVAQTYRNKIIEPLKGTIPVEEVALLTEQLSGSCTTEIASFNEFTKLLQPGPETDGFDYIIFDTAPTGHTLRLLQLPTAWSQYLGSGSGDVSCLGPMAALDEHKNSYANAVTALSNDDQTTVVLVARPETASINEALRTREELQTLSIMVNNLVINGVLPISEHSDDLADGIRDRQQTAINNVTNAIQNSGGQLQVETLPLLSVNLVGVPALENLLKRDNITEPVNAPEVVNFANVDEFDSLVADLAALGHGLVMTMGKGGVGKTTIAAALAVRLAELGHQVLLTTTDPASHLEETIGDEFSGLQISKIDPDAATQAYRAQVMASRGASLDQASRVALAEDLKSPCTQEIAVFQAFSRAIGLARKQFVVIDTAPTGHTLLLLDATGSYHRDVLRHMGANQKAVTPMMRLQDSQYTKVIVVTLPETTPVLEASSLVEDLQRAGITPWAWVINNSLAAAHPGNPVLASRAALELPLINDVLQKAPRVAILPTQIIEPKGKMALLNLSEKVFTDACV